jgi:hypothetical protein
MAHTCFTVRVCIVETADVTARAAIRSVDVEVDTAATACALTSRTHERAASCSIACRSSWTDVSTCSAIGLIVVQVGTVVPAQYGVDTRASAFGLATQQASVADLAASTTILHIEGRIRAGSVATHVAELADALTTNANLALGARLATATAVGIVRARIMALPVAAKSRAGHAGRPTLTGRAYLPLWTGISAPAAVGIVRARIMALPVAAKSRAGHAGRPALTGRAYLPLWTGVAAGTAVLQIESEVVAAAVAA